MFSFDEAVEKALLTWYPKDHPLHMNPHHPLGKLLGEWGELLDDYMKSLYKPGYVFEPEDELGDIWYYVRILYHQFGYTSFVPADNLSESSLDRLMTIVIHETSLAFFGVCKGISPDSSFINLSYNLILEICRRYNLTLDDLTRSNWQKLKPGSERGEEWMKARVGTDYASGGKIGLK